MVVEERARSIFRPKRELPQEDAVSHSLSKCGHLVHAAQRGNQKKSKKPFDIGSDFGAPRERQPRNVTSDAGSNRSRRRLYERISAGAILGWDCDIQNRLWQFFFLLFLFEGELFCTSSLATWAASRWEVLTNVTRYCR